MNTDNRGHLYTFWNPNLQPNTIEDHIITLKTECAVKWLILYSEEVRFAPRGQAVHLRDLCTDRILFTSPPWDKEIARINKCAREHETLLYMQCLNIFHKPLYVGKIDKVERVKDNILPANDPLIPLYYYEVISGNDLKVGYAVTLTDMREIRLSEVSNLIPVAEFGSMKYPFAYPFLVHQKQPRAFFNKPAVDTIDKIEIEVNSRLKGGRVIKPHQGKELKLSDRELELIRFIFNLGAKSIRVTKIANHFKKDGQYVQSLVSRTNNKFKKHFGRPLIKLGGGKYTLSTKIKIIKTT